jgi:hypothetical protein
MATLGHRLNLAKNETVSCWMVQHNGDALLDGKITDYLIKRGSSDESGLNISNENKQQEKQGKISNVKHKLEKIKPDSEKDSK